MAGGYVVLLETVTGRNVVFRANGKYAGPGVDFDGLEVANVVVVGLRVVVEVVVDILGAEVVVTRTVVVGFSVSAISFRVVVVLIILVVVVTGDGVVVKVLFEVVVGFVVDGIVIPSSFCDTETGGR